MTKISHKKTKNKRNTTQAQTQTWTLRVITHYPKRKNPVREFTHEETEVSKRD